MSGHKNIIELNGKIFDAVTGKPLHKATSTPSPDAKPQTITPTSAHHSLKSKGMALDGFMRKPSTSSHNTLETKTRGAKRSTAQHAARHSPQRTKTLIRKGLSKPTHTANLTKHESSDASSISAIAHLPHNRLERAQNIPKSHKITRFGSVSTPTHWFDKKQAPVAVKPAPAHKAPAKTSYSHIGAKAHSTALAGVTSEQLVQKALSDAPLLSHHTKPLKKNRLARKLGITKKTLNLGAGMAAALLLGGFILFQNSPNLSMRLAASRAGFNAQMPGYKPAGFGLSGPIQHGPGQVTVNFKSHSDDRNFHITQRVSQWNSEALLDNFVVANKKSYQTYIDKGRTIYIYDGSNATWVSGGVWYQIEGSSSLNSEQLLRVANSI